MISDITKIQEQAPAAKPIASDSSLATEDDTLSTNSTKLAQRYEPQEHFTLREKLAVAFSLVNGSFDPTATGWSPELCQ